jgi:hypothetical protein
MESVNPPPRQAKRNQRLAEVPQRGSIRLRSPGGEMRGGAALKAYKRYAGRMTSNMSGAELRDILTEILGEEAVIQRTSGYIVQGVTLKCKAATSHAATY